MLGTASRIRILWQTAARLTLLSGCAVFALRAQSVDSTIKPGDNFFAYANGEWLRATAIPSGTDRWTARTAIDEVTRRQIQALFDAAGTASAGSLPRLLADFRTAYANDGLFEARSLAPLRPLLDSIDDIHDRVGLARYLGADLGTDVDPLNWGVFRSSHVLGLSVEMSIHGERTYVPFLLQGGLGLPDRESYSSAARPAQERRTRYVTYIRRLLAGAGFAQAERRAQTVMALESALAETQATPDASANDHNADSVWTATEFARRAPGMDWSAFFSAAALARQDSFVAWQPGGLRGVAALVASRPLDAWKDYLRFHLLDRYADVLPHAFSDAALTFRGTQSIPRSQRAFEATQVALSDVLGRLYAERYFPAAQKARVEAIVANVIAAFERRLDAVTWMSPRTRALALAKIQALYVGVGYPDRWEDYSDLTIDPRDAVGNLQRIADRTYRHTVARLGQPVDRSEWLIAPQRVGAILAFQQNAYDFSAALLQTPKYDSTASDAAAYGAIGAIIGHDVTHYVDVLGAEYEVDGRERRWWTPEDSAGFDAAANPLVAQVSAYRPFPDVALNGALTRTENVADLGGLVAAFDAYRRTLGARIADTGYVRQQDRQFFLGFARSWRAKLTEPALRAQAAGGDHAPDRYRVAIVRNLDAWYDAFDVRPGQRLYLDPSARVRIW